MSGRASAKSANAPNDIAKLRSVVSHPISRPEAIGSGRRPDGQRTIRQRVDKLAGLQARDLLEASETSELWVELSWSGEQLARERWRGEHRFGWEGPPAPPLPYRRALPLRIAASDRRHPSCWPDEPAEGLEKVNIMRARMECGERAAAKAIAEKPELKAILERFNGV